MVDSNNAMETDTSETTVTLKSTKVDKQLELDLDVGHLMASDPNELSIKELE